MAKILVIDDDPSIIAVIEGCLSEAGHTVFTASDAYTGINVAARERPDLITLDFEMPAGDGGKVHERLRGNMNTGRIPIIFITGVELSRLPPLARGDTATRYIPKPIDMNHLKACAAEMLGLPAAKKAVPPAPPAAPPPPKPLTDEGTPGGEILDLDL